MWGLSPSSSSRRDHYNPSPERLASPERGSSSSSGFRLCISHPSLTFLPLNISLALLCAQLCLLKHLLLCNVVRCFVAGGYTSCAQSASMEKADFSREMR